MKALECVNCGAPLRASVCDYCGSIYSQSQDMPLTVRLEVNPSGATAEAWIPVPVELDRRLRPTVRYLFC